MFESLLTSKIATIPGRPPLHERSISAPAEQPQQIPGPEPFLNMQAGDKDRDFLSSAIEETFKACALKLEQITSPKQLPPLVIPDSAAKPPQPPPKRPANHGRSGSVPSETCKSSRNGGSPTRTPYTASTSLTDLTTPRTASTNPSSTNTLPTPISAPALESHRSSPRPWEVSSYAPTTLERSMTPQPVGSQRIVAPQGHRRGGSESSSIMDRGRPRKRTDRHNPLQLKRAESKSEKSSERKAFQELPSGFQAKDAVANMGHEELASLHKQAYRQAERFEILKEEDVQALSKVSGVPCEIYVYVYLQLCRNFDASTNEQTISARHTHHYELDVATCTLASVSSCARLAPPSLATSRCSSKKKLLLSWMLPSMIG